MSLGLSEDEKIMKNKLAVLAGSVLGFAPLIALAQATTDTYCQGRNATSGTIQGILCEIANLLRAAIPVLIVLAILYFIWGVIQYVIAGDEEAKAGARSQIIYGLIGVAVIAGVWGLVNIILGSIGAGNGPTPNLPSIGY